MRKGARTAEFFSDGAMVVPSNAGSLSRAVAGLGLAALMSFAPSKVQPQETWHLVRSVLTDLPMEKNARIHDYADKLLTDHIAEVMENATIHQYGEYEVSHWVAKAIVRAARDADFPADYLMAIAEKESSFDCDADSSASSALGCFQYIEQSWLSVIKRHGTTFGLGDVASKIVEKKTRRGAPYFDIEDESLKDEVLDMRRDPYLSAVLTASDLQEARRNIEAKLDIVMGDQNLYLPHFVGEDAAAHLLAAAAKRPQTSAKRVLPTAARYNRAMFHGRGGHPLSVSQFVARVENVIVSRSEKYADIADDVKYASLTTASTTRASNDNVTEPQRQSIRDFMTEARRTVHPKSALGL
jgi:hypothetical protein